MQNYSSEGLAKLCLGAIALLIGICIIASLTSCSVDKKIAKAYKGVAVYDALTAKDSANFYSRAKKMIKTPPPIVKEGKTIRVPYPVTKLKTVIDSVALQDALDSLGIAQANDLNNLADDCMESVKKATKEGIKTGYARAQYEAYLQGKEVRTDSAFYIDPSTGLLLDEANLKLREAEKKIIQLETENGIIKKKNKSMFWWLIALIAVFGVGVVLKIKSAIKKPIKLK